jgi:signal transduction histidine kinase
MLAFVRRESQAIQTTDLNAVVRDFDKMLGHFAGEATTMVFELAESPLPVRLDRGQLELALINLVRNANDAMSVSGQLTIGTSICSDLSGSPTAEVSVSDTGTGMSPDVVQRATDPFFTTKEPGRGSGLGLWMVQRFARSCRGRIDIKTTPGKGTTVRLLFPLHSAE